MDRYSWFASLSASSYACVYNTKGGDGLYSVIGKGGINCRTIHQQLVFKKNFFLIWLLLSESENIHVSPCECQTVYLSVYSFQCSLQKALSIWPAHLSSLQFFIWAYFSCLTKLASDKYRMCPLAILKQNLA